LGAWAGVALVVIAPSLSPVAPSASSAAAPATPAVVTGSPTSVQATSATLQGSVNPNEAEVVACRAEYGLTLAYGALTACEQAPLIGHEPISVSAKAMALDAGATYHFRFSITYAISGQAGREEETLNGPDQSFVTPLLASTSPPTVWLTYSGAEPVMHVSLLGYVEDHGADVTRCAFEYGTTPSLGIAVSVLPVLGSSLLRLGERRAGRAGMVHDLLREAQLSLLSRHPNSTHAGPGGRRLIPLLLRLEETPANREGFGG
jgi:hypothetical protein